MIDSHTHLDSCEPSNAELVGNARAAGLKRMLTVGMDSESCHSALAAAHEFDEVFAAIGRHPNYATGYDETVIEELAQLARDPRCVAIGETGLDQFRDHSPIDDQRRAFADQIELARELSKPLVIHTRAADQETIDTLVSKADGLKVIMHCFSIPDRLDECLQNGWFISFSGNVTYPKNGEIAAAAARVPDDRILVETDAPFLSPQSRRKERNQPANVAETARFVAQLRNQSYEEFEVHVETNAAQIFGW